MYCTMPADLFSDQSSPYAPLAALMRPTKLDDYVGQQHLLAPGMALRDAIEQGQVHSMLLWGPPGTGKTTLAKLVSHYSDAAFITLSAVLSGVKDIREAVERAKANQSMGKKTILFVDEVHRFNKSQQDAFLPHVEDGTIIFIGATTENPSFEINNALLSRARVYVLKKLTDSDISALLNRALTYKVEQTPQLSASQNFTDHQTHLAPVIDKLAIMAQGDARKALNMLELLLEYGQSHGFEAVFEPECLTQLFAGQVRHFDNKGDLFYEQISALHKAVRGSSADGALYWLARMLDGGCDPLYVARRVVRMASEDIGNADPRGLSIALNAWDVQERLGSPEGELAIAQAVVYLACAPKSNAVYTAFKQVMRDVKEDPAYDVPVHLRNAPTELMKEQGFGAEYRYAHDEPEGYAAGEAYLPEEISDRQYYQPVNRGLEIKIGEKLNYFKELDESAINKRY